MADVKSLIRQNLDDGMLLQLATVSVGKPWVSTLYFIADDDFNIYWVSQPDTRHSQEVAANPQVAASIPLDADPGSPNTALQIAGRAELVSDPNEIKATIEQYADKFKRGKDYAQDFIAGKTDRMLYRLTPELIVLFDEQNFPDAPSQEWRP